MDPLPPSLLLLFPALCTPFSAGASVKYVMMKRYAGDTHLSVVVLDELVCDVGADQGLDLVEVVAHVLQEQVVLQRQCVQCPRLI